MDIEYTPEDLGLCPICEGLGYEVVTHMVTGFPLVDIECSNCEGTGKLPKRKEDK